MQFGFLPLGNVNDLIDTKKINLYYNGWIHMKCGSLFNAWKNELQVYEQTLAKF